jgi:hypothetical protein
MTPCSIAGADAAPPLDLPSTDKHGTATASRIASQHGLGAPAPNPARAQKPTSVPAGQSLEDVEVKWSGVSVADRGGPVASCSRWHGDGTAGEREAGSEAVSSVS